MATHFNVLKISFKYKSTDPSIHLITEIHFLTFLFFKKSTENTCYSKSKVTHSGVVLTRQKHSLTSQPEKPFLLSNYQSPMTTHTGLLTPKLPPAHLAHKMGDSNT